MKFDPKTGDFDNVKPRQKNHGNNQNLHVYSARCAWSGPISKVGKTKGEQSIPCCPHCGSVLFQMDEKKWWSDAESWDKQRHANYVEFWKWSEAQPRCWPTVEEAAVEFKKATRKEVVLQ